MTTGLIHCLSPPFQNFWIRHCSQIQFLLYIRHDSWSRLPLTHVQLETNLTAVVTLCKNAVVGDAGEQAGRYLFLSALRTNSRQAHCRYLGGEELEKDGRWWTVWLVLHGV